MGVGLEEPGRSFMGCSKAKGGHGRGGLELDFEPRKTPGEVVVAGKGK